MRCSQCMRPSPYSVCDAYVEAAGIQIEGALGGRPTPQQIARIFDMGGAGIAPKGCHTGRPVILVHWDRL